MPLMLKTKNQRLKSIYCHLKFVIIPQSCTSPVFSPIYDTVLQKRNSFALELVHKIFHQEQSISVHHVTETSLKYNQRHSICLKYIPSFAVGKIPMHGYQSPLCWHKEKFISPLSSPSARCKGGNAPVKTKYSCHQVDRRWSAYEPEENRWSSRHHEFSSSCKGSVLSRQESLDQLHLIRLVSLIW